VPRRAANGRTDLKATQKRVLAALEDDGAVRLTRGLYEEIAGVSRSQAAYDLAELVSAGMLERIGGGRSTWYRVVRQERPGQRRWTNDKIRTALEQFCAGREAWPSATEFKEAGHSDLYVAASRYGGIAFWTKELGLSRPTRTTTPEPAAEAPTDRPRPRWRPRLRWSVAGVAFAAALFAAGGASFYAWHGSTVHHAASSEAAQGTHAPVITLRVPKLHSTRPAARPRPVRHVTHSAPSRSSAPARTELAVRTVSAPSHEAASTRSVSTSRPSQSSSAPAPLPAPSGGSGPPPPLPPPGG